MCGIEHNLFILKSQKSYYSFDDYRVLIFNAMITHSDEKFVYFFTT